MITFYYVVFIKPWCLRITLRLFTLLFLFIWYNWIFICFDGFRSEEIEQRMYLRFLFLLFDTLLRRMLWLPSFLLIYLICEFLSFILDDIFQILINLIWLNDPMHLCFNLLLNCLTDNLFFRVTSYIQSWVILISNFLCRHSGSLIKFINCFNWEERSLRGLRPVHYSQISKETRNYEATQTYKLAINTKETLKSGFQIGLINVSEETPQKSHYSHEREKERSIPNYYIKDFLWLLINVKFIVFEKSRYRFKPAIAFLFDSLWVLQISELPNSQSFFSPISKLEISKLIKWLRLKC